MKNTTKTIDDDHYILISPSIENIIRNEKLRPFSLKLRKKGRVKMLGKYSFTPEGNDFAYNAYLDSRKPNCHVPRRLIENAQIILENIAKTSGQNITHYAEVPYKKNNRKLAAMRQMFKQLGYIEDGYFLKKTFSTIYPLKISPYLSG